jgi:hypothetical protein
MNYELQTLAPQSTRTGALVPKDSLIAAELSTNQRETYQQVCEIRQKQTKGTLKAMARCMSPNFRDTDSLPLGEIIRL